MLLAVHISDGVLEPAWLAGGWVIAAVLVALGLYRLSDTAVPRVALMAAVFFVASLIHVPAGIVRVHLLLNGLVGVLLGPRSAVAIAIGLTLQALLVGHGGLTCLGVNITVMALPALIAWGLFPLLRVSTRAVPAFSVGAAVALEGYAVLIAIELLPFSWLPSFINDATWRLVLFVAPALVAIFVGVMAHMYRVGSDWATGLILGVGTVLLTVTLNYLVLRFGSYPEVEPVTGVVFLLHLPVAVVEGLILASTMAFLASVKPEWLQTNASPVA